MEVLQMNTDKIYAEAIANEYAPKDTSKVVALKKLDHRAKAPANIFAYTFGVIMALVLVYERTYYYNGEHYVVTGIGTNGYIVSAYPKRIRK